MEDGESLVTIFPSLAISQGSGKCQEQHLSSQLDVSDACTGKCPLSNNFLSVGYPINFLVFNGYNCKI